MQPTELCIKMLMHLIIVVHGAFLCPLLTGYARCCVCRAICVITNAADGGQRGCLPVYPECICCVEGLVFNYHPDLLSLVEGCSARL